MSTVAPGLSDVTAQPSQPPEQLELEANDATEDESNYPTGPKVVAVMASLMTSIVLVGLVSFQAVLYWNVSDTTCRMVQS